MCKNPIWSCLGWQGRGVEVMFYTILALSRLFSHIWMWFLVIFRALWNDSQTEETEELCFAGRTRHSATWCCGWQGMRWQTHWQLQKPSTLPRFLAWPFSSATSITTLPSPPLCLLIVRTHQSSGSNPLEVSWNPGCGNFRIELGSSGGLSSN